MKTSTLSILLTLIPSVTCFAPNRKVATTPTRLLQTNRVSEITHELQELGNEIKPHVIDHKPYHIPTKDSLVHKLRRELHEKDKTYHTVLDELERVEHRQVGIKELKSVMESTLTELKQQNVLLRHKKDISKEHEDTITELLDTIRKVHDNLVQANAYAVAWETAEVELWREKKEYDKLEKEHESVRKLLWQATKLTGRRIKNLLKRMIFGKRK
mmetsp:Transcript_21065/g.40014  ORF Transcript_21065/g.40014 Transcript_21065/m.40014 type:complete len:214 (+) Transcript_21065:404-1045(+)|eukprot:scaffold6829_cov171-Amphora_coffeaeformis.AAC.7